MWVVKPVESFVGDLGMEVFSQKFIQMRVFFGIFNDISNHVYFHFLDSVNWQQNIDFSTMHHKSCGHKIYDKGFHLLLFLIHQNNSPLCWLWPQTKYLLILRASDMWTPSDLSFLGTFKRKKDYVLLFIDVLDLKWSLTLVCPR